MHLLHIQQNIEEKPTNFTGISIHDDDDDDDAENCIICQHSCYFSFAKLCSISSEILLMHLFNLNISLPQTSVRELHICGLHKFDFCVVVVFVVAEFSFLVFRNCRVVDVVFDVDTVVVVVLVS